MTDFDPETLTQDELQRMRAAAESAWSDDTRHPAYAGHPDPSAGCCYVTSRWMQDKLGGHVGNKDGHYFWVSPDKTHVVDLTGDQFSHMPEDLQNRGIRLDEDDEGWIPTEDQTKWRPGPVMYKRATHPLFRGFRVKSYKSENPRVKAFAQRANEAYDRA